MNNAVGSIYFNFHHNCSFHRQSKMSAAGAESDNEPHVIEPAPDSGVKILGPKIQGPKVLELRVPSVHLNISKLLKTVRLMKKHFTCTAWASISTACQSF